MKKVTTNGVAPSKSKKLTVSFERELHSLTTMRAKSKGKSLSRHLRDLANDEMAGHTLDTAVVLAVASMQDRLYTASLPITLPPTEWHSLAMGAINRGLSLGEHIALLLRNSDEVCEAAIDRAKGHPDIV